MLFFACGLMMLATAAAKLKIPKIPSKVNLLVTAVSFIECNSVPPPGTETSVHGEVKLAQLPVGGPTAIFVNISGLPPNTMHGFHIHEYGDTVTDGCQSTGSHYNPLYQAHGAPQDKVRHVGDLGNLISNHNGVAIFKIVDPLVSLVGPLSVVGRAIVIHEKIDDLGRGAGPAAVESLKTGNAGARLACGAILLVPLDMLEITDLMP